MFKKLFTWLDEHLGLTDIYQNKSRADAAAILISYYHSSLLVD